MNDDTRIIIVTMMMLALRYTHRDMCAENHPYAGSSLVLLARLSKQVMRRSSGELLGMDLRLLMALSYLGDHDGAPQQELVDALCMDAKNVVLLLNELEDCGHLVRRRDSDDRRRHRVYITTAGREALERAARALEDIEDDVLQALNADERASLGKLLSRALRGAEHAAASSSSPPLTSVVR
jgi:DNA-binding MarR family transcriptional regulator